MTRWIGCAAVLVAAALTVSVAGAAKPPKQGQLTISAAKTRIVFGRTDVISGHLSTSPNAGQQITLEQNAFPFNGSFSTLANGTTNLSGDYSFTVRPSLSTRYRTQAPQSKPKQTSATVQVDVAFRVGIRVSDTTPARGQVVRFSGRVAPASNGRAVAIQRRSRTGTWVTLASTLLKDAGNGRSKYSRRMHVRRGGRYRAFVAGNGALVNGASRAVRLRVH